MSLPTSRHLITALKSISVKLLAPFEETDLENNPQLFEYQHYKTSRVKLFFLHENFISCNFAIEILKITTR